MATSEMRGFVFSVIFIIVFATLLASIPAGLQGAGAGADVETVIPIDPNLITGFSDTENYTGAAFTFGSYEYSFNDREWIALSTGTVLSLAAKIFSFGFWLGHLDVCNFVSDSGTDRGDELAFTEITTDADEGGVRYSLQFILTGDSAGSLVVYWNTTAYDNATHAWDNDKLYLLHGVGFDTSATTNIGALLVSLLLLQLPDVPVLVNALIAVPVWACIVYVLWYVVKEMIPFV